MFKTHEKSRFEHMRVENMEGTARIILQVEQCERVSGCAQMAIVETVSKADFDLSTLETKLAAAEKQLEDEAEAHRAEVEEAGAKAEALEELLAEASDERERMKITIGEVREENMELFNALTECRRIFGELPLEIEKLLGRGEE